jgi:SSS family solute:Na+ symporter
VIGLLAWRFSGRTLANYLLGGRWIKHWVAALGVVASGRPAWLILGASGLAFKLGLSAVWALPGYIVTELFMFWIIGARLRRFLGGRASLTLPDYLEQRFGDQRHLLRISTVALFFLFTTPYIAAQFRGSGKVLHAALGLDPAWGIVATALLVLVYTVLGGFLGVALTEVLQALLMLVALVGLPLFVVASLGGAGQVLADLGTLQPRLAEPFGIPLIIGSGSLISLVSIGLGSPGNPHVLVRYLSAERPRQLKRAALIGAAWNVLMGWGAIWIGLAGRVVFVSASALPRGDTEYVFALLAQHYLPPLLTGLVFTAVLAAILSTSDAHALSIASNVVRGALRRVTRWGSALDERALVRLSRLVVALLIAAALAWGLLSGRTVSESETVFWLVLFAWSGMGASFGPVMILSLYWPRMTRGGAFAGLLTGAVVTAVWGLTPALDDRLYELVPAFVLATLAVVVVSLLTGVRDAGSGTKTK